MSERPARAELQSAIRKLEQLGNYQTYFGDNPNTTVDAKVPHYQEYNYLHNLVTTTQLLVDHYDDATWLKNHQATDQTFADALIEMQHAHRGCSLIFGANHTTETKNEVPTTSNTPNISNSNQATTVSANAAQSTTTTSEKAATTGEKSNVSVKAETFTPVTTAQPTPSATTSTDVKTNENNTTNDIEDKVNTTNEIAVPATGNIETSSRQVSWPALIAVVVTGAVIASIAITVIIRHEPRRTTAPARSRRRY